MLTGESLIGLYFLVTGFFSSICIHTTYGLGTLQAIGDIILFAFLILMGIFGFILIIDDNFLNARLIIAFFRSLPGRRTKSE